MVRQVVSAFTVVAHVLVAATVAGASPSDKINVALGFEENLGQAGGEARFVARGDGFVLTLDPDGVLFQLRGAEDRTADVRLRFAGGASDTQIEGHDVLPGVSHYYRGNDSRQWITGARHYTSVRYANVYPGIDVLFYARPDRSVEYDFVVAPGADPSKIAIDIEGDDGITLDGNGDLVIESAGRQIIQRKPIAFQRHGILKTPVSTSYRIESDRRVALAVAPYDSTQELVIDPVVTYVTYLGGSLGERIGDITVDAGGNVYATGNTFSPDFFATGGSALNGGSDIFVTRLNAAGNAVIFSAFLGGSAAESDGRIAVDGSGNIYVSGSSSSADFPVVNAAQPTRAGSSDFVVVKLSPNGTLLYSTYVGGSSLEVFADGMAIDANGAAFITGQTLSQNYPTTAGAWDETCGGDGTCNGTLDGVVTKLSPSGAAFEYSTYLGGTGVDLALDIAVDSVGAVYVTGMTTSTDLAITPFAVQPVYGGDSGDPSFDGGDAFLVKLSPAGDQAVYATYIGGSDDDGGFGVAVDGEGNAYVVGATTSLDFPVTAGALQTAFAGGVGGGSFGIPGQFVGGDGFVAKVDPAGAVYAYATYIGGSANDKLGRVEVRGNSAYASGQVRSTDMPVVNAIQPAYAGGDFDGYAFRLDSRGENLLLATYLGGSDDLSATAAEFASGIALDPRGDFYVSGGTSATDLPVTAAALQTTHAGSSSTLGDGWIAKLEAGDNPAGAPDDHYLCYKAKSQPKFETVDVVAIADPYETINFAIIKRSTLCNPADKNGEGVVNPEVHLLDYKIKRIVGSPKHVRHTNVVVEDQLGAYRYDTIKERGLFVPSSKDETSPVLPLPFASHSVDAHKCYKVKPSSGAPKFPKGTLVDLEDQFAERSQFSLIRPTRLCLAADKAGAGVKNPDGHLLCYRAKRTVGSHFRREGVHANNELEFVNPEGPAVLSTIKELEVCLPSVIDSGSAPECGDDIVNQATEQCDGNDDLACPGPLCQSDCSCAPAGVCGNDFAESPGEECDGLDDSACPGECTSLCACLGPRTFTIDSAVSQANTSLGVQVPLSGSVDFIFTSEVAPGALAFDIPIVQLPGVELGALFGAICPFLAEDPSLPPGMAGRGVLNCSGTSLASTSFLVSPRLSQFQDHCVEGTAAGFCDSAPNPGGGITDPVTGVFLPDDIVDPTCTLPGNIPDTHSVHGGGCTGESTLLVGATPYLPGDSTLTLNVILDRRASGDPCLPPVTPGAEAVKINFTTGAKDGGVMDFNAAAGTVSSFELQGTPFDCQAFLLEADPTGASIVGVFPAVDAPLLGTLKLDILSSIRFTGQAPP